VAAYGKIAYSPANADPMDHKKRIRTSLGRYLNRQENLKNGAQMENACNAAMAAIAHFYPISCQFSILRGEELMDAYKNNVGGGSCMSGSDPYRQKCLGFYANNPDRVGLLVWGKKRGRALIWTLPEGGYYIDRIYSGDGNAYQAYEAWAKENGVLFSYEAAIPGTKNISSKPCQFEMEWENNGELPYFDTLDNLGGGKFSLGSRCICDRCGENCGRNGSHYIESTEERVCNACFDEYYATCTRCNTTYLFEEGSEINGGEQICAKCALKFIECEICCTLFDGDTLVKTCTGAVLCEECVSDQGYVRCTECNAWDHCEDGLCEGCAPAIALAA
jgi:hypothetical protein